MTRQTAESLLMIRNEAPQYLFLGIKNNYLTLQKKDCDISYKF